MNSFFIILFSSVAFFLGYRFYARKFEQVCEIDPKKPTPAVSNYDGVDFVPAKNWLVLFGHHFSSIAGAGPIIGPVIACILWGWLPALVWVIFGTIFIGAVHDYGSLVCSVRKNGSSISEIAGEVISKKAKTIFSIFVWLALILVIAVFAYFCADTFIKEPKVVLPSLGLIPVAMIVGFFLYNLKANNNLITVLGLVCLVGLMFWGNNATIIFKTGGLNIWIIVLLIYCFIASVLPVHMLLQPRDYLSSFLLVAGLIFGYLGLLISHPTISQPAYVSFKASEGWMWPMMCVTVACGAVSGFHAIVSSGTTSKQLPNERFAKRIGYGAMVVEGLLAVMALLAICSGIRNGNTMLLLKEVGPINAFSKGYGEITKNILGSYGGTIAVILLNAFILTTLDTATRIGRYLTEEIFGIKNRFLATAIVILLGGALALSGAWQKIWPIFGASNQLVAALALLVISSWLLSRNKPLRYTFLPAIFMFVTTVAALVFQIHKYFITKDYILLFISATLLILSFYLLKEAIAAMFINRRKG